MEMIGLGSILGAVACMLDSLAPQLDSMTSRQTKRQEEMIFFMANVGG
jgi:hypothetical protein